MTNWPIWHGEATKLISRAANIFLPRYSMDKTIILAVILLILVMIIYDVETSRGSWRQKCLSSKLPYEPSAFPAHLGATALGKEGMLALGSCRVKAGGQCIDADELNMPFNPFYGAGNAI